MCFLVRVQTEEKLSALSSQKEKAEKVVRLAVDKANEAMTNLRKEQGEPWDGRRVNGPEGGCPESLKAKVCVCVAFGQV